MAADKWTVEVSIFPLELYAYELLIVHIEETGENENCYLQMMVLHTRLHT